MMIERLTGVAHGLAQAYAPYDTGALVGNITKKVRRQSDMITGSIISDAIDGVPYNWYQELGTGVAGKQGVIHPRSNANPRVKMPLEGVTYNESYAGFGAQPFMYPAFKYVDKNLAKDMDKASREGLKR